MQYSSTLLSLETGTHIISFAIQSDVSAHPMKNAEIRYWFRTRHKILLITWIWQELGSGIASNNVKLIVASREVGLLMNKRKTKYMVLGEANSSKFGRHQNLEWEELHLEITEPYNIRIELVNVFMPLANYWHKDSFL